MAVVHSSPSKGHHPMHLFLDFGSQVANGHIRLRIFDGSFQIYSILQLQNCNSVEEFYANFLNLCGLHNQKGLGGKNRGSM